MAIWQYKFSIIPEDLVRENTSQHFMKSNDLEEGMFWNGYCLSDSSIEKISETLKETKSWSGNIKQFGNIEETCIEALFDKNNIIEVSIRLDLRSITSEILKSIIDFIKENNALILTSKGMILNPTEKELIEELKKSEAYTFVNNPKEFLDALNKSE